MPQWEVRPSSCPMLMSKILTQYGLSSCKRLPPVKDHLGLTFWVVTYRRFDCSCNNGCRQCYSTLKCLIKDFLLNQHFFSQSPNLDFEPSFNGAFVCIRRWLCTTLLGSYIANMASYYMTSSVSGQDAEPNLTLWLPAWDMGFALQGKFIMLVFYPI